MSRQNGTSATNMEFARKANAIPESGERVAIDDGALCDYDKIGERWVSDKTELELCSSHKRRLRDGRGWMDKSNTHTHRHTEGAGHQQPPTQIEIPTMVRRFKNEGNMRQPGVLGNTKRTTANTRHAKMYTTLKYVSARGWFRRTNIRERGWNFV
ncbi:unnamed protein product [Toxocara canis]|uniref:AXH domain-containing protein n=1 Tax=Toxocara canis TaxID=6265 RepID=A0A183VBA6_TOXCA|nr:unnamed protein product [Toxocara canis]